jgi:hypothetical protein
MSELPPSPYLSDMECNCQNTYHEHDSGNSTTAGLCRLRLIQSDQCNCTSSAQCEFCLAREPFVPTQYDYEIALDAAHQANQQMDHLRAEWLAEQEMLIIKWEYDYLDLHCEGGGLECECRECLLSPRAQEQFNEQLRIKFQSVLELPLWYEAFQNGNSAHKDPSAWTSKRGWRLAWNMHRQDI